ncbi:hypothetical protein [Paraflavitalea speifideaquila]|uniref:hypothetical protein n=1 Tax=Paraflavitalea speifideaquila TaxID=3076558 RepID=UPI0028E64226|nr:hypothetical protein [Paraflavitalea speifideiaquila]
MSAYDGGVHIGVCRKRAEALTDRRGRARGKGLAAGADHEDAAFVLPFKGRLAPRANNEDGTLLNADQRASSGSHEIILHNKTFKNEK